MTFHHHISRQATPASARLQCDDELLIQQRICGQLTRQCCDNTYYVLAPQPCVLLQVKTLASYLQLRTSKLALKHISINAALSLPTARSRCITAVAAAIEDSPQIASAECSCYSGLRHCAVINNIKQ